MVMTTTMMMKIMMVKIMMMYLDIIYSSSCQCFEVTEKMLLQHVRSSRAHYRLLWGIRVQPPQIHPLLL